MKKTIYKTASFRIIDDIDTVNTLPIEVHIDESPYISITQGDIDDPDSDGCITITHEMAKDLVYVLQNMLKEDNDQQPK